MCNRQNEAIPSVSDEGYTGNIAFSKKTSQNEEEETQPEQTSPHDVEKINLLNVSAETCVTCVTEPQTDCLVSTPAVTQPSEKMCNRCVTSYVTTPHPKYSIPILKVGDNPGGGNNPDGGELPGGGNNPDGGDYPDGGDLPNGGNNPDRGEISNTSPGSTPISTPNLGGSTPVPPQSPQEAYIPPTFDPIRFELDRPPRYGVGKWHVVAFRDQQTLPGGFSYTLTSPWGEEERRKGPILEEDIRSEAKKSIEFLERKNFNNQYCQPGVKVAFPKTDKDGKLIHVTGTIKHQLRENKWKIEWDSLIEKADVDWKPIPRAELPTWDFWLLEDYMKWREEAEEDENLRVETQNETPPGAD
jgi:hypothetical protein